MKSICIKTNNTKAITYLLNQLYHFTLDNIYFSHKKFKNYNNIIIHFKGNNEKKFLKEISNLLASLITEVYEKDIIQKILSIEYFYLNSKERKLILCDTIFDLYYNEECILPHKDCFKMLSDDFNYFLKENKSIVLKGFITFRIKNYIDILLLQIDKSVNKFIIEREYTEFISLLKMYVNTELSHCNTIHLIYNDSKSILLDENNKTIISEVNFTAKYLSDISFSSNDYALNTILTLNPKKIYIHLIDNNADEFINTIKLVFEDRCHICTDCNICMLYKHQKENLKTQ